MLKQEISEKKHKQPTSNLPQFHVKHFNAKYDQHEFTCDMLYLISTAHLISLHSTSDWQFFDIRVYIYI